MTESLNVGHDGRADILRLEPGCLALQAQEPTRSGECCPQASGDGTAAQGARSGPLHQRRSAILYPALSLVPVGSQGHDNPAAGDRRALASRWTSPLLALEIRMRGRPAANRCGIAGVDLADERGQSALGCTAHSWRTTQAQSLETNRENLATFRRGLEDAGYIE